MIASPSERDRPGIYFKKSNSCTPDVDLRAWIGSQNYFWCSVEARLDKLLGCLIFLRVPQATSEVSKFDPLSVLGH